MATRLQLQSKLEELLESRNVYYQPPSTLIMKYPCIRYTDGVPDYRFANDKRYKNLNCYDLIVISKKPNDPVNGKILETFSYCAPGRSYVADNLYHTPYTLYY